MAPTSVYDHIRWKRLEVSAPRRTRPNPSAGAVPYRPNQGDHGTSLNQQASEAIDKLNQERRNIGANPQGLAVLELNFLEAGQRSYLERLKVQILEETEVRKPLEQPFYSLSVQFESLDHLNRFKSRSDHASHNVQSVEVVRGKLGAPHEKYLELRFSNLGDAKQFIANEHIQAESNITSVPNAATKVSYEPQVRIIAQFEKPSDLTRFKTELENYQTGDTTETDITDSQRRELFDALNQIKGLAPEDRMGLKLKTQYHSLSTETETYFDVDLWHPGNANIHDAITRLASITQSFGGTVTDSPTAVGDSLLISRVRGTKTLVDALLRDDRVALVEYPISVPAFQFGYLRNIVMPDSLPPLPSTASKVCIVDSGVVAGHPLLRGTVFDERDFASGDGTSVDTVGHGTHIAGVIVYGDLRSAIQSNQWEPKVGLLSAKVLKNDGHGRAVFSDEKRAENQIRSAIRTYHEEYSCRIFNLSIGNSERPYLDGRQLPWALVLDELSRELDIICVVSAGNVSEPEIPEESTSARFQETARDQLLSDTHALIDPATSLLSLTVGAIAHSDVPFPIGGQERIRPSLVASPRNCPSPFSRTGTVSSDGPAPKRAIKPELVAHGGNYCLGLDNRRWNLNDTQLGVPSLNFQFAGNSPIVTQNGTSVAAGYVSHCAALVEEKLRVIEPDRTPSANLIRCLTTHSANVTDDARTWMGVGEDAENRILRSLGYGKPDPKRAISSAENRVTLFSEDTIQENYFHLYEIILPEIFVETSGSRKLRVTLAYDPPVRGSRREYLSRNMWFKVFRGLTSSQIELALSNAQGTGEQPRIAKTFEIDSRPTFNARQWSTVQSSLFEARRTATFGNYRTAGNANIHLLVGCTARFKSDDLSTTQNYAIAASLEHSNETIQFYNQVKQSVRPRIRL